MTGEGAGGGPRVLALRALGLGDLLTAVPALRALRRALPGHQLVLAAPQSLEEAVRTTEAADVLLPTGGAGREVPEEVPWPWPEPPRLALDLHGNGPPSRDLLARLAPGRLFAYAEASGPSWRPDEHERARWCRLLTWYGIPADPADLLLPRPGAASPAPGAVVVHPGADAGARRWPADRFASVARELSDRGAEVVVTHGAREGALAHGVAERAGLPRGAVLGGPEGLPFGTLATLVAEARAVVVGDTGLAHLASALATPSVVLFGPVSPAVWGPPPHDRHRPLWRPGPLDGAAPGDPHGPLPDPRLLRLAPHEVVEAVEALPRPRPVHFPGPAS
ncbi:glycosyltransferase family 9 protein [Streptomyces sulphureus]|uniref:glycosyltransferase family 9 protein n=1 Tax=Streptomyces sulphureus TaxID=47758 RepID=UPI000365FE48|nr:glycosyltransferase family 9 protein [Streptomyces sulphureus]